MNEQTEIFKDFVDKSPRIKFLEKHNIKTKFRKDLSEEEEQWEAWMGYYGDAVTNMTEEDCYPDESRFLTTGKTEDEAIRKLIDRNGLELW